MTDPRPMLQLALDQAQRMIDSVGEAEMHLATPCSEYDVRMLLGHLLSAERRLELGLTGGDQLTIPMVTTEVTDYPAEWRLRRAVVEEVLADASVLDRVCALHWVTLSGAMVVVAYTAEFVTHSWDLAKAVGRTELLDDSLAEYCLGFTHQLLPAESRPEAFGPVVEVPADAPVYDRMVAWSGRTP